MLSRALILATVMLSILVAAPETRAQNLEAGKSPSQIFAGTCAACHRSQRGLLKTVPPGSLPGFLREHYTTSRDMAQQLSTYLLSNGATDPRGGGDRLTKQGKDARSGGQSEPVPAEQQGRRARPDPREAAKPDADGLAPDSRGRTKRGRAEQRQAAPALGPDGQPLPDAVPARQKQKMGKKKGRDDAPKMAPAPIETAKPDAPRMDTQKPGVAPSEPAIEAPATESARPAESARPNGNLPEPRPDPVPQVTPALRPDETEQRSAPVETPAPSAAPEPTIPAPNLAPSPAPSPAPNDPPPRPTISVTPPPPPPPPSGPAAPPISQ